MVCEEQSKVRAGSHAWKVLEEIKDHHHLLYSQLSCHLRAGSIHTTSAIFERPSCFFLSQFLPQTPLPHTIRPARVAKGRAQGLLKVWPHPMPEGPGANTCRAVWLWSM